MRRSPRRSTRLLAAFSAVLCTGLALAPMAGADPAPASGSYHEPYRPQFHFTPTQNWMNDPNGLVYYQGEYHLFFQYNPSGNTWGNMSWGHAVSTDLVHWQQLPLAIPQDNQEMIFSGSAVVDKDNTTGFGTPGNPAMVAIYTSQQKVSGKEEQALAYSTDRGRTWTKYAGNPVLDIGSKNFRDPKVFWYEPTHSWLMTVALSDQHKVSFYSSPDLKRWSHLSDFGPAGGTDGVWECPDLFPLQVDGDPHQTKWVVVVGTRRGAAGTAVQYFTGNFDGRTFTSDDPPTYTPPAGTVLQDFESGYHGWTTTGTAFGNAPATGTLPGQQTVSGYLGSGLVNTFLGGDAATGTLTSPSFTVSQPYLNFLVGGGDHPMSQANPTAVNLLVDGKVVRTATGANSEALDWTSWDLRDLAGKQAQIQIVDDNSGGWGHILADQFTLADTPAQSSDQRAHWVDSGADFYASATYNDTPDGRRIMLAWMNNWNYGGSIPTSPWRSTDTLPRELALRTIDGRAQLIQQPVNELNNLRTSPVSNVKNVDVPAGTTPLAAHGGTVDIQADLDPGTAQKFGLNVRTGSGQQTQIGYDTTSQQLYIDRTQSGDVSFNPGFPSVQRAPLALHGGHLKLHVLVDESSVEVFADQGQVVLTDQIFPNPDSEGISAFAEQGNAKIDDLSVQQLKSIWP